MDQRTVVIVLPAALGEQVMNLLGQLAPGAMGQGVEVVTVVEPAGDQSQSVPWERIPDRQWDRRALMLWIEGFSCAAIARQVGVTEGTIFKRLIALRKAYGTDTVPLNTQRNKRAEWDSAR
jgi:hypothetical protein